MELTPPEIVSELDRYIIGQNEPNERLPLPYAIVIGDDSYLKNCGKKSFLKTS